MVDIVFTFRKMSTKADQAHIDIASIDHVGFYDKPLLSSNGRCAVGVCTEFCARAVYLHNLLTLGLSLAGK